MESFVCNFVLRMSDFFFLGGGGGGGGAVVCVPQK